MKFSQKMPLYFFYTMVQKVKNDQKLKSRGSCHKTDAPLSRRLEELESLATEGKVHLLDHAASSHSSFHWTWSWVAAVFTVLAPQNVSFRQTCQIRPFAHSMGFCRTLPDWSWFTPCIWRSDDKTVIFVSHRKKGRCARPDHFPLHKLHGKEVSSNQIWVANVLLSLCST